MKILLDESIPIKLKTAFGTDHDVFTVKDMGWLGVKNGTLLKFITENKFDAFITVDKNLPYQNQVERFPFTIFILNSHNNRLETLQALVPKIFLRILQGELKNIEIII